MRKILRRTICTRYKNIWDIYVDAKEYATEDTPLRIYFGTYTIFFWQMIDV